MTIFFEESKAREAAVLSISHEGNVGRAKSTITKANNNLIIKIESEDIVALRATANAYMRALQIIEEVKK